MKAGSSKGSSMGCNPFSVKGRSIAITGKGGTGKTMLATLMIKILSENVDGKILAIDADSAISLPYTLGMKVGKTVSDVRREIIEIPEVRDKIVDQHMRTVMTGILEHGTGFDLLVMGRPEEPGCFCTVNDMLRYGIDTLIQDYNITIIDGEAGPEQLNRRVLKSIDTLLVVADMSARSLETAGAIIKVAKSHGNLNVKGAGLVMNRFRGGKSSLEKFNETAGVEIIGCVPEDETVNKFDREGRALLDLPHDSPAVTAVREMLKQVTCLNRSGR